MTAAYPEPETKSTPRVGLAPNPTLPSLRLLMRHSASLPGKTQDRREGSPHLKVYLRMDEPPSGHLGQSRLA